MKAIHIFLICVAALAGCQSLPDGPAPSAGNGTSVFLSAQHCLSEYLDDLKKVHYGPCLKITGINGVPPTIRDDGFIELPVATALTLNTSCVYRLADGSLIPATFEETDFAVTPQTFTRPGERWYLHAQTRARQVVGCKPTLSRSIYPTEETD